MAATTASTATATKVVTRHRVSSMTTIILETTATGVVAFEEIVNEGIVWSWVPDAEDLATITAKAEAFAANA